MSERAEELVDLVGRALLTRDKEKADAVIAGDREVDALEVEVERLAVELLALQQPMARDLRFIISAIKVSSDLERVGDHAVNIAQCALSDSSPQRSPIIPDPEIEDMARRARAHARATRSTRSSAPTARSAARSAQADDQVDALHDSVFRILLTHMMADAADDQPVARAAAREPQPRARGGPGDQHRRGRRLPRRREADQASLRRCEQRGAQPNVRSRPRRDG